MGLKKIIKTSYTRAKRRKGVNTCQMYGDILFSMITSGMSEGVLPLDKVSNQVGYNRVLTKNSINFYVQVNSMGRVLDVCLLSQLRDTAREIYRREVKIDLMTGNDYHRIRWSSSEMKSNVQIWQMNRKKVKEKKEVADSTDAGYTDEFLNESMSREEWRSKSWRYFKEAEKRGSGVFQTSIVFRVRIPKKDLDYASILFKILTEIFEESGLYVKPIALYLHDAIDRMSPFKHEVKGLSASLISDRTLTTEVLSALTSNTQGRLNSGNVILGNDIYNRQLVHINTHPKDGKGTNILLLGETGSGKSYLMKSILEQILAIHDYIYINDYERIEYTPFGLDCGAVFIDLNGRDGKYFEPLDLSGLSGESSIFESGFQEAINGTYQLITTLLGHELSASQKNLLSITLKEYAEGKGVYFDDPSTWESTETLSVKELLPYIKSYARSEEYKKRYGSELTSLADTMELNFDGVNSYMFKNPISFRELKDAKCIIVNFGGDSTGAVVGSEQTDIRVKQLTQIQLDSRLSKYRRSKNESFVLLFEEVPRYLKHQGSEEHLNELWLGIRKCNGTAVGVINDPSKLQANVSSLVNNTQTFIIGKSNNINSLGYLFDTPKLKGTEFLVEQLANKDRCFMYKDEDMVSLFRVESPKAYSTSEIMVTRTDGDE